MQAALYHAYRMHVALYQLNPLHFMSLRDLNTIVAHVGELLLHIQLASCQLLLAFTDLLLGCIVYLLAVTRV